LIVPRIVQLRNLPRYHCSAGRIHRRLDAVSYRSTGRGKRDRNVSW
jgi:hypothetical protein